MYSDVTFHTDKYSHIANASCNSSWSQYVSGGFIFFRMFSCACWETYLRSTSFTTNILKESSWSQPVCLVVLSSKVLSRKQIDLIFISSQKLTCDGIGDCFCLIAVSLDVLEKVCQLLSSIILSKCTCKVWHWLREMIWLILYQL